jgi:hypothetical protein
LLVAIPLCVVIVFQINQVLIQIGAVDLAGAGAAVAVVREIGPIVSVLIVAGAGATAICADLGSRKIREEIDAMVTLGIDPIERLVASELKAAIFGLLAGLIERPGGQVARRRGRVPGQARPPARSSRPEGPAAAEIVLDLASRADVVVEGVPASPSCSGWAPRLLAGQRITGLAVRLPDDSLHLAF